MINPLFNLPSFLIGMYFGIVNYTIQRGITNSEKNKHYISIESLSISNNGSFVVSNLNVRNKSENYSKIMNKTIKSDNYIKIYNNEKENISHDFSSKSNEENNNTISSNDSNAKISFGRKSTLKYDEKIKEMPFLISAINFTDFHRTNQDRKSIKIILSLFIFSIFIFCFIQYIYIYIYTERYLKPNGNDLTKLALENIIPNKSLNIIYLIDIELVVFMINWIFFILHFRGGQIIEFLNHYVWIFFIKSYFSIVLITTPIILYIFYQSETVINVTLYNIFLYSLINIILIFFGTILFYSFFELPFKKIFKSFKIRKASLKSEIYEDEGDEPD